MSDATTSISCLYILFFTGIYTVFVTFCKALGAVIFWEVRPRLGGTIYIYIHRSRQQSQNQKTKDFPTTINVLTRSAENFVYCFLLFQMLRNILGNNQLSSLGNHGPKHFFLVTMAQKDIFLVNKLVVSLSFLVLSSKKFKTFKVIFRLLYGKVFWN